VIKRKEKTAALVEFGEMAYGLMLMAEKKFPSDSGESEDGLGH
jgi:hypothetical protein